MGKVWVSWDLTWNCALEARGRTESQESEGWEGGKEGGCSTPGPGQSRCGLTSDSGHSRQACISDITELVGSVTREEERTPPRGHLMSQSGETAQIFVEPQTSTLQPRVLLR